MLSGSYIWLHSLRWWRLDSDSIFLLANFGIIYFLGKPWSVTNSKDCDSGFPVLLFPAVLIFGAGVISGISWLMSLGWVFGLYCFLKFFFNPSSEVKLTRLIPFAFFGFPWIALDGQTLGWYFRISGAATNEWVFSMLGLDVAREGVNMVVSGVVIRVTDECAGLNALQAMMTVGGFLAFHFFSTTKYYWPAWVSLLLVVWISNTLRIFLLGFTGLTFGVEFAMGPFHDWGGMVALTLAFVIAGSLFQLVSTYLNRQEQKYS